MSKKKTYNNEKYIDVRDLGLQNTTKKNDIISLITEWINQMNNEFFHYSSNVPNSVILPKLQSLVYIQWTPS